LLTLGFFQVFLKRTQESFESARAKRLKVYGKPSQYGNIRQFIDEQNLFKKLISKSILPTLELNISDSNIKETVEKIVDCLSDTGGLWAK
jgi:transcriptional/translational regulatory protein YebC/TACO1